jgi:hypothetical protein
LRARERERARARAREREREREREKRERERERETYSSVGCSLAKTITFGRGSWNKLQVQHTSAYVSIRQHTLAVRGTRCRCRLLTN